MSTPVPFLFIPEHIAQQFQATRLPDAEWKEQASLAKKELAMNLKIISIFLSSVFRRPVELNISIKGGVKKVSWLHPQDKTLLSLTFDRIIPTNGLANASCSSDGHTLRFGIVRLPQHNEIVHFTSLDIVAHQVVGCALPKQLGIRIPLVDEAGTVATAFADIAAKAVQYWAFQLRESQTTWWKAQDLDMPSPENDPLDGTMWGIGDRIANAAIPNGAFSLRRFDKPGHAYWNHPLLGDDEQRLFFQEPHIDKDHSGVQTNSGPMVRAFYRMCVEIPASPVDLFSLWTETLQCFSRHSITGFAETIQGLLAQKYPAVCDTVNRIWEETLEQAFSSEGTKEGHLYPILPSQGRPERIREYFHRQQQSASTSSQKDGKPKKTFVFGRKK